MDVEVTCSTNTFYVFVEERRKSNVKLRLLTITNTQFFNTMKVRQTKNREKVMSIAKYGFTRILVNGKPIVNFEICTDNETTIL